MLSKSHSRAKPTYIFEVEQQEHNLPIRFTQPQTLGPLYGKVTQPSWLGTSGKTALGDVLKRFESCPFENLRELVVAFAIADQHNPVAYHDWQSNLLLEQYQLQPELQKKDRDIIRVLNLYRQELICVERLSVVLDQLAKAEENFRNGADATLRNFAKFEAVTAEYIVKSEYREDYQRQNVKLKQQLSEYFELQHIQEWFLKAVAEVRRLGYVQPTMDSTDIVGLQRAANQSKTELTNSINTLEYRLDNVRRKVGLELIAVDEQELHVDEPPNGIVLHPLYNLMSNIQPPNPQIRRLYEQLRDGYDRYLKKLRDVLHIIKLIELESVYRDRVLREQRSLTEHLKYFPGRFRKHYQLLVPYQESQDFKELRTNVARIAYTSESYARELFDLQNALVFVNSTYGTLANYEATLFKLICDSKETSPQASALIGTHTDQFSRADAHQGYNVILLQSLRRLESLNSSNRQ